MKSEFLKKLNAKVIAIVAAAVVIVAGGGAAIALAATANASKTPEISEREAKAAVFSHAGITEDDVLSLQIDKGTEDGLPVYEIDFKTAEKRYDYDIVRSTGEILHAAYDVLGGESVPEKAEANSAPAEESPASATEAATTPTPSSQSTDANPNSASAITEEQAKSIALKDAGVAESDAQFLWVEKDYEDGRAVYDVEFYADGTEYDYEIDCSTGEIISSDFDMERYYPNTENSGTIISADQARDIALAKVPGATEKDIRIHLDRDDGYQIYEGEIYYDRMEYEFEIDALTGTVIAWSAERWDSPS